MTLPSNERGASNVTNVASTSLAKLREELHQAIPNPSVDGAFKFEKLETLPYLRGCLRESIRFSLGLSSRTQRLINEPLVYKDWIIPPNTPVSMSIRDVSFDETIFEDAHKFKPERWMDGAPKAEDGSSLERYFVGFGKGPRSCLGIK